jgi:hypothetical protein
MRPSLRLTVAAILSAVALQRATATADEPAPFELRHGDRVVLIGSTLIERAESFGYIETALSSRYPRRNILFRNLGWLT